MRQEPDFFGDDIDLDLVYIAKKLKEALAVEALFTEVGLDYVVQPETYTGGVVFQTQRTGAFFYVSPDKAEESRALLKRSGYEPAALS